ncbi:hypothetical protein V8C35DRAFT_198696 [Trichoderma chlorosporum]
MCIVQPHDAIERLSFALVVLSHAAICCLISAKHGTMSHLILAAGRLHGRFHDIHDTSRCATHVVGGESCHYRVRKLLFQNSDTRHLADDMKLIYTSINALEQAAQISLTKRH